MLTWFDGRTLKRAFFINSCNFKATTKTILFTILYPKKNNKSNNINNMNNNKNNMNNNENNTKKYDFIVPLLYYRNFSLLGIVDFLGGGVQIF